MTTSSSASEAELSADFAPEEPSYTSTAARERHDEAQKLIDELDVGEWYAGKVVSVLRYGAIVELENGARGMVHISQLREHFVQRVEDEVVLGEEVSVRLLSKPDIKRVAFTMRGQNEKITVTENCGTCAIFRLPYHWSPRRIKEDIAQRYGEVLYVDPRNSRKENERVVTFVVFANKEDAETAATELPGLRLPDDPYLDDQGHPIERSTQRLGAKFVEDYTLEFKERFASNTTDNKDF